MIVMTVIANIHWSGLILLATLRRKLSILYLMLPLDGIRASPITLPALTRPDAVRCASSLRLARMLSAVIVVEGTGLG